jgi:hypothetical protein
MRHGRGQTNTITRSAAISALRKRRRVAEGSAAPGAMRHGRVETNTITHSEAISAL